MTIRDATRTDLPELLAIYNEVVATSTAIYRDTPATLDDRRAWWEERVAQGYPVLVAADASGVVGFASFGDFRAWPCYRFTVEHTVHVRKDRRGTGIGGALMRTLVPMAFRLGKHVMIAGVDADNVASLRFHERLGFVRVAHFREVGFKFERWLDLIFLQRWLTERARGEASS
jgi:L-amino acid N-acyltransferase YncA